MHQRLLFTLWGSKNRNRDGVYSVKMRDASQQLGAIGVLQLFLLIYFAQQGVGVYFSLLDTGL